MQPPEQQAEVGVSNLGVNQVGSVFLEIGIDLLGRGTIGPAIRVRDMVTDTANTEDFG